MFVWQHILSAIILGLILKRYIFTSINVWNLLIVLVLSQAIDLDHFKGEPTIMVKCALMTSCNNSIYNECQKSLDRGVLHSPEFLILILGVTLISYFIFKSNSFSFKERYIMTLILCFGLGIILHFILDFGPWKGCWYV